jgi:hypothetical protein
MGDVPFAVSNVCAGGMRNAVQEPATTGAVHSRVPPPPPPHAPAHQYASAARTRNRAGCAVAYREAHRLFTGIGAPIRAAEIAKELGLAPAS